VPNFTYVFGELGFVCYCIAVCLNPVIIVIILLKGLNMEIQTFERGKSKEIGDATELNSMSGENIFSEEDDVYG